MPYLIDLDGTVYRGLKVLNGASDLIRKMNEKNLPYRFLTNAPEVSPGDILQKLHKMDVPAREGTVITSAILAVSVISQREKHPRTAVFGNAFLRQYAQSQGLVLTRQDPDYVLMSFCPEMTMADVNLACQLIRRGATFVATNPDDSIPSEQGAVPHLGGVLVSMTAATGIKPFIAGKPSSYLRTYFTRLFDCEASDIRVIGDRLDTDMGFARSCGFKGWLVLTGSTSQKEAFEDRSQYDHCFQSVEEICSCL